MSLQLSSKLLSSSSSLSPSSPDRDLIIGMMFFLALSLILHFAMDTLALVGVIKRSDEALKVAFGLWMFLVFWSTLAVLGLVFGSRTPDQDEMVMPVVFDYLLSLAYGTLMYQYRQLLKGQTGDEESRAPLLGASR
ncbi:hypothetical protein CPB97_002754 [Podila verticillata]|nr:hypothetical protein CPB97_002754 [Podila verticillata]